MANLINKNEVEKENRNFTEEVKDKALEISDSIKDNFHTAVKQTKRAKKAVLKYVKQNPGKSVGAAFLLGFLYVKARNFGKNRIID